MGFGRSITLSHTEESFVPITRMFRALANVGGLCAVGVLAVTPGVRPRPRGASRPPGECNNSHPSGDGPRKRKGPQGAGHRQGGTPYFLDDATIKKDSVVGRFAKLWPPPVGSQESQDRGPQGSDGIHRRRVGRS